MFKPCHHSVINPPTSDSNKLLRATCGLKLLYLTISIRKSDKSLSKPKIFETMTNGKLDISHLGLSQQTQDQIGILLGGRFKVLKSLGEGTFAQTLLAVDLYHPNAPEVAIKVMNSNYNIIGAEEYKRLIELNYDDPNDNLHIVRLITTFSYNNQHFCLVFERLYARKLFVHDLADISLPRNVSQLLPSAAKSPEERRRRELEGITKIRKLALQLMLSLMLLKDHELIHADIKPDNVLFVKDSAFTVKLIDFGNAFYLDQALAYHETFEVQTLLYRAPEVLIGLPFGCEIDMWSVGMLLCESWLGRPLLRANSPEQMLSLMIEYFGPLPKLPFMNGKFYKPKYSTAKAQDSFGLDLCNSHDLLKFRIRKLSEVLGTRDLHFLYFLNSLLEYDPEKRLGPSDALAHPFLSSLFPFDRIQSFSLKQRKGSGPLRTPLPLISPHPVLKRFMKKSKKKRVKYNTEEENALDTNRKQKRVISDDDEDT